MRTLTDQEMQRLEAYVRHHCGWLIEVYTELLDHLACSIEAQWRATPDRPFAEALQRAESTLGSQGIRGLITRRRSLWYQEALRLFRQGFLACWRGPGLPITLVIGWSCYRLLQLGYSATALSQWSYMILMVIFFAGALSIAYRQWRRGRRYQEVEGLLIVSLVISSGFYNLLIGLPMHLPRPDWLGDGVLAAVLALFFLVMYLLVFQLLLAAWWAYRKRERMGRALGRRTDG